MSNSKNVTPKEKAFSELICSNKEDIKKVTSLYEYIELLGKCFLRTDYSVINDFTTETISSCMTKVASLS